jgi:hypothetical protein
MEPGIAALLISGPIRRHLWKPLLAVGVCGVVALVCGVLLIAAREHPGLAGWLPLHGRWLRQFLIGVLLTAVLVALALLIDPLLYFVVLPVR